MEINEIHFRLYYFQERIKRFKSSEILTEMEPIFHIKIIFKIGIIPYSNEKIYKQTVCPCGCQSIFRLIVTNCLNFLIKPNVLFIFFKMIQSKKQS